MTSGSNNLCRFGRALLAAVLVTGGASMIVGLSGCDDGGAPEPSTGRDPSSGPPKPLRQGRATKISDIRDAIMLEAQEAMGNGVLPETSPTFAARHDFHPDQWEMSEAVVSTQSSVPFLDSYVRWQMTSYVPLVPEMDDEQFREFVSLLPALVQDPRNDPQAVAIYERSEGLRLTEASVRDRLETMDTRLLGESDAARALLSPGLSLRSWYIDQFKNHAGRQLRLQAELIDRTITSGWPVADEVARLDAMLRAASDAQSIRAEDAAALRDAMTRWRDHRRTIITAFRIADDGTVTIDRLETGVPIPTLDAWVDLLERSAG